MRQNVLALPSTEETECLISFIKHAHRPHMHALTHMHATPCIHICSLQVLCCTAAKLASQDFVLLDLQDCTVYLIGGSGRASAKHLFVWFMPFDKDVGVLLLLAAFTIPTALTCSVDNTLLLC